MLNNSVEREEGGMNLWSAQGGRQKNAYACRADYFKSVTSKNML